MATPVPVNPISPAWPVAGLCLLHCGGAAGAMLIWCLHTAGLMQLSTGINLMATVLLGMLFFYGFCALRFYRGTNPPEFTHTQKGVCMLAWFMLTVLMFKRLAGAGFIGGCLAMAVMIYAFFAFIALVMCGKNRRRMVLVCGGALCGVLGWGTLILFAVRTAEDYLARATGNRDALLTDELARLTDQALAALGPNGLLVAAVLLVLVSAAISIFRYWCLMPVPPRQLFGKCTAAALLLLLASTAISQYTLHTLRREYRTTAAEYRRYCDTLTALPESAAGTPAASGKPLAAYETELREIAAAAARLSSANPADSPFAAWEISALQRWVPAPRNSTAALNQLRMPFETCVPLFRRLDALCSSDAALSNRPQPEWLRLFTLWHLQCALQLEEWDEAATALRLLAATAADNGQSAADTILFGNSVSLWFFAAQLVLETPAVPEILLAALEQTARSYHDGLSCLPLRLTQSAAPLLAPSPEPAFGAAAALCPWPQMTACADATAIMRFVMQPVPEPERKGSPIATITTHLFAEALASHRRNDSRMNALRIQIAALRYQRQHHTLPPTPGALVPDFLPALPEDPAAPASPYRIAECERETSTWNYTSGRSGISPLRVWRIESADPEAAFERCLPSPRK